MISISVYDKVVVMADIPFGNGRTVSVVSYTKIDRYKEWCNRFVGANNWNYYGVYQKTPCVFKFRYPEDLLAFKITFDI